MKYLREKKSQLLLVTVLCAVLISAFSAPNITRSDDSLIAYAPRWLPKPDVIWSEQNGSLLSSSTQFYNTTLGIVQVMSSLQVQVTNGTYTCVIQSTLVKAVSKATVEGINDFSCL